MSCELDSVKRMKCPCEKGEVVESNYSNDWLQQKTEYLITCNECLQKYHIEYDSYIRKDHVEERPYLVPHGETLSYNRNFNTYETPFSQQLCLCYTKSELEKVYDVLCSSTTYSKIKDNSTRKIIRMSSSTIKTMRIKTIQNHVLEALEVYSTLNNNYEVNCARTNETRKKSICIYNLKKNV